MIAPVHPFQGSQFRHELKRMYSVESSKSKPEYLELLREWCLVEWSKIDSFDVSDKGIEIPAPLVALLDRELIGGLAFTSYPIPGDTCFGLWVNAVIVTPDHRGKALHPGSYPPPRPKRIALVLRHYWHIQVR